MSKISDYLRDSLLGWNRFSATSTYGGIPDIATVGATVGAMAPIMVGGLLHFYRLMAGTEAHDSPVIIRPTDYAAATNEKYWQLITVIPGGLSSISDSAPPSVTDDIDAGWTVGSRKIDTVNGWEWVCVDSTAGAAVWLHTSAGAQNLVLGIHVFS